MPFGRHKAQHTLAHPSDHLRGLAEQSRLGNTGVVARHARALAMARPCHGAASFRPPQDDRGRLCYALSFASPRDAFCPNRLKGNGPG